MSNCQQCGYYNECEHCGCYEELQDIVTKLISREAELQAKYEKVLKVIKDIASDQDHRFSPSFKEKAYQLLKELGEDVK